MTFIKIIIVLFIIFFPTYLWIEQAIVLGNCSLFIGLCTVIVFLIMLYGCMELANKFVIYWDSKVKN